jgi:hypothetical protein
MLPCLLLAPAPAAAGNCCSYCSYCYCYRLPAPGYGIRHTAVLSQLGLLDGDLQLSNLVLRKKSWFLSQNVCLDLESGSIGRFTVQVPWLQLHTGNVNVFADSISLVFRLNLLEHEDGEAQRNESLAYELKALTLRKEELRLLSGDSLFPTDGNGGVGMGASKDLKRPSSSWLGRTLSGLLSSAVSKITSKFSLTANK